MKEFRNPTAEELNDLVEVLLTLDDLDDTVYSDEDNATMVKMIDESHVMAAERKGNTIFVIVWGHELITTVFEKHPDGKYNFVSETYRE